MGREQDEDEGLSSFEPRTIHQDAASQSVEPEASSSPKEIVAEISHEIWELSERLKKSPVIHANSDSAFILEAMSKFSLPHQAPLECFSPSNANPYKSLRELHTGRSRVERSPDVAVSPTATEKPIGHGLNANFREAGTGPRTSRVFNAGSLPCIAASSYSEGSVSGAGGTMSDQSSDFFNSSHVNSVANMKNDKPAIKKEIHLNGANEPSKEQRMGSGLSKGSFSADSSPRKHKAASPVKQKPASPRMPRSASPGTNRSGSPRMQRSGSPGARKGTSPGGLNRSAEYQRMLLSAKDKDWLLPGNTTRYVSPQRTSRQVSSQLRASVIPPSAALRKGQQQRSTSGGAPRTSVVDSSGWFCGCRAVDPESSPYAYKEHGKASLQHPHGGSSTRSVFGNFIRKIKGPPNRKASSFNNPPSEPDPNDLSCNCSFRQADGSVALEAEFRKMARDHEERMKSMQENVEDMMRTIASQLQQLETRTSISMDNDQVKNFWHSDVEPKGVWDSGAYRTPGFTGPLGPLPDANLMPSPPAQDVLKFPDSSDSFRFHRVHEPFQSDALPKLTPPEPSYDDGPEPLSPFEPPSLLEWQQSSPQSSGSSSSGGVPYLNRLMLEQATRDTRRVLHQFAECLVEDQDADAVCDIVSGLLPRVRFVKPRHARYGLESCIAGAFFSDFDEPFYGVGPSTQDGESDETSSLQLSAKDCWEAYQRVAEANPRDIINDRHPDSDKSFHYFCQAKLKLFQEEVKWISKWSVNLLNAFLEAAMGVWRLHLLSLSFEPSATLIHASQFEDYNPEYMELVDSDTGSDGNSIVDERLFSPSVEFTIMPGFKTHDGFVRCQVYLKVRTRTRTDRHVRQMTL